MIEVFRGSFLEAMNVKNLLENNNIIVFTANEYMSSIDPWSVAAGGYVPAILKVNKEDYDNAKKVVDDFYKGEYILNE
jgi:hypothetical protein